MQNKITNEELLRQIQENRNSVTVVETEIRQLRADAKELLAAFTAAKGAFAVLEWVVKVAKPIMIIVSAIGAAYLWSKGYRG